MSKSLNHTPQTQTPLSLVFYDVYDPESKKLWAGTAAHIINSFRSAGHRVRVVGNHIPFLRRCFLWLWYHYYLWIQKKYYHPDRDVFWTRIYSKIGSMKLGRLRDVDAVITCSPPFTAFLDTPHPIFLLHDATWGQMVETYPHFSPSRQAPRIVKGGFILDRIAFNKPNVFLVMSSQWAADRVMKDYGVSRDKIAVLPFGANFHEDPKIEQVQEGMRKRGGSVCQILFVGRDWERKGGPLAVEITAALRHMGVPAELHVIGCNPKDTPEFVQTYGLLSKDNPEHLRFMQKMYAESDFFLMPTRAEAQGIVFNESAAYALPVVSTDVGGVSAVVRPDWGLLLPPDAAASTYAAWIKRMFADRKAYLAMATRARQEYERRLSSSVYMERLTGIIEEQVQTKMDAVA